MYIRVHITYSLIMIIIIQVYVLSVLVFLYIQGPVGRRKIPTNYSWLPGDMRRLGGANTLGTLQMGSDAVLGTGHRHQERWHIIFVEGITMEKAAQPSCIRAKLHRSSQKCWRNTESWPTWQRRSAALFTIFIQTGSRA